MTLDQLVATRARLVKARSTGVRSFRDQNGEQVEYKTDREMAAALAALDAEIATAGGRAAPRRIVFRTSKGL